MIGKKLVSLGALLMSTSALANTVVVDSLKAYGATLDETSGAIAISPSDFASIDKTISNEGLKLEVIGSNQQGELLIDVIQPKVTFDPTKLLNDGELKDLKLIDPSQVGKARRQSSQYERPTVQH